MHNSESIVENETHKVIPVQSAKDWYRDGNKMTNRDHPHYSIVEISQNTEESPGALRRLAITQTLVRTHQLTLM